MQETITYRGYRIEPFFNYSGGRCDWQYYEVGNEENSGILPYCYLAAVKEWIDFKVDSKK